MEEAQKIIKERMEVLTKKMLEKQATPILLVYGWEIGKDKMGIAVLDTTLTKVGIVRKRVVKILNDWIELKTPEENTFDIKDTKLVYTQP